jgi:hypothetical protein
MGDRIARPKITPPGSPRLGKERVTLDMPPGIPDPLRYSEFDSARYGGPGATVEVEVFPTLPWSVGWPFGEHDRPEPRVPHRMRARRVPGPTPQTVPDRTRQAASGEAAPGVIEVLEVT